MDILKAIFVALFFTGCAFGPHIYEASSPKSFNYERPANLLQQLGSVRATFIVADSLLVDEPVFQTYCQRLARENYNVAFVNVQSRGFFMGKPGYRIETHDEFGNTHRILIPGHPLMKVQHPIKVMRKYCTPLSVAVIPWFEYNWMADLGGGVRNLGMLRGTGFTENLTPKAVSLTRFDLDGNEVPPAYDDRGEPTAGRAIDFMYPTRLYLRKKSGKIFDNKLTARWMDPRNTEVRELLLGFARKLADEYGPLQNWDRVRFVEEKGSDELGLDAVRKDPNNLLNSYVAELSGMLRRRGGALWATVVKNRLERLPDGTYVNNDGHATMYGQHWTRWKNDVQLFVVMTYYWDTDLFRAEAEFLDRESVEEGYNWVPIAGVDAGADQIGLPQNQRLISEMKEIAKALGGRNQKGFADWFFLTK